MNRTVHLYVAREIISPFVLSLFILTFVLLMFQILKLTEMVVAYGVSLENVGRLILYILPPFFVFTVPMSFLLAVLLAFGRMSADSELIALRASGFSLYQLYPMVGFLSLATGAIAMFLTVYAEPWGKNSLKEFLFELARTKATIGLKERVFNTDFSDLVLYVQHVDPKEETIEGVFISDERAKDKYERSVILANSGSIVPNPANMKLILRLKDGSIHRRGRAADSYEVVGFRNYDIQLQLGSQITRETRKTHMEMSIGELDRYVKKTRREAKETGDPQVFYHYRRAYVEYHKKFAFPVAAIIFGFLGIPLSINPVRSGRSRGFTTALVILIGYYMMFRMGETIGWKNDMHPAILMWAPNALLGGFGLWLFVNKARETEIKVSSRFDKISNWLRKKFGGHEEP